MVGAQFWSSYTHCPKDSETKEDVPLDEATVYDPYSSLTFYHFRKPPRELT
jgi:hypothetical protein